MKILATRRYPGPAFERLDEVEVQSIVDLREARPEVEVLVVANEPVPFDLLPFIRLVANFGVGYDRIDLDECRRRGIAVTNTPGVLDAATSELALALLLAVRRRVVEGDRRTRAGEWHGSWADGFLGEELAGSTIGIIGLGRIGSVVARRAQAFEMRVLYARRSAGESSLGELRALDDLLRKCDAVSIHVPLLPSTEGLVDARRLSLLRDGATLINTARGEIVDEGALVRELVSGRISAGLDVFAHEPHVPDELCSLPNVVLTPHLGSATTKTREAMTELVVENILAFENGRDLVTPVT